MGKSDDSITRRKNRKTLRKQESKSKVTTRVASIIASKKRRLSGKRRMCQGMCFSLPSIEDPFNDRHGKPVQTFDKKRKDKKGGKNSEEDGNLALVNSFGFMGPEIVINVWKKGCKIIKKDGSVKRWKEYGPGDEKCPSSFLCMCLKSMQEMLDDGGDVSENDSEKPLFANKWGIEFWNCYTNGKDVLENGRAEPTVEQIAWMVSTAADTISLKEKEGVSFDGPFLLYLVPSQDRAQKVRQVCMPLKSEGVHAVSLHTGVSVEHQINGLKSCEPEFLIATPERLLELLSLNAIDISGISLLIIDGLEAPFKGAYFEAVKSIREFISGDVQTVVFCDCKNTRPKSGMKKLGKDKFYHK